MEISDRAELPDPGTYRGLDEALEQFNSVGSEFDDYRVVPQELTMRAYSDREQALAAVEAEEGSPSDQPGAGWSAS